MLNIALIVLGAAFIIMTAVQGYAEYRCQQIANHK